MTREAISEDKIAADVRDVLSRFKANRLQLDEAEAELLALFAATRQAPDATGISGLRSHD